MTTVAVLCDPPRPGLVLRELVATSPLTDAEAADLYAALLRDSVEAVAKSRGELLVNYRPEEAIDVPGESDAEEEVRAILEDVIDTENVRFEVQVGETFAGRAGNTATHLLESEGVTSVAVTRPEAAFLARTDIDGAAMRLRSSEVVLGGSPGGRVYYAGFGEPVDFAGAYEPPAFGTLTDRALKADLGVDFLESKPYLGTGADLADVLVQVRARRRAGGIVPRHLAQWVADSDLEVEAEDKTHHGQCLTLRKP